MKPFENSIPDPLSFSLPDPSNKIVLMNDIELTRGIFQGYFSVMPSFDVDLKLRALKVEVRIQR